MQIIEGRNPVIEALRAGRPISRILIDRNAQLHGAVAQILQSAKSRGVVVELVDKQDIDSQSQTGASQGVIAFAAAKDYVDLDDLFSISRERREAAFYLVLDGIEDPHNLGAILRTAEATGVHGVVIRERRAVGLTPAVVKASAGAVEYVPVAMVTNISQAILTLKKNNVWVIRDRYGGRTELQPDGFQSSYGHRHRRRGERPVGISQKEVRLDSINPNERKDILIECVGGGGSGNVRSAAAARA